MDNIPLRTLYRKNTEEKINGNNYNTGTRKISKQRKVNEESMVKDAKKYDNVGERKITEIDDNKNNLIKVTNWVLTTQ